MKLDQKATTAVWLLPIPTNMSGLNGHSFSRPDGTTENQPLTKSIVSGFLFVARFLLGFGGFYDNSLPFFEGR